MYDSLAFQIATESKFHCESIGCSDQFSCILVFFFLLKVLSSIFFFFRFKLKFILIFLPISGFRCCQYTFGIDLLTVGKLGETVGGIINKKMRHGEMFSKHKFYFYSDSDKGFRSVFNSQS